MGNERLPLDHPFFAGEGVLVMAHRGGGGLAPENTMTAFEQAVQLGADILELDIRSTRDGVLVVIHDESVERLTNGVGRVNDLTLAELKQLDFGYRWTNDGGHTYPFRGRAITIPTLEELFGAFSEMRMNIDIKQSVPPIFDVFGEMLHEFRRTDKTMVASFDVATINAFRERFPEVPTASDASEVKRLLALSWLRLEKLFKPRSQAVQISEYYGPLKVLSRRFVRAAHRVGLQVHPWTVDELADMQRLIALGADGIISDRPDRLLRLLGRLS